MGGYGRGELAPYSDLDVVLVSDEGVELGDLAERVWYPLWDSGARLDHSVRTFPEMLAASDQDLKVALGLLDIRHLAGDTNLTLRLRTTMLTGWRRQAKERLPALRSWSGRGTSCSASSPTCRSPTSRRRPEGCATRTS